MWQKLVVLHSVIVLYVCLCVYGINAECSYNFTETHGEIFNPSDENDPSVYPNNTHCTYTIMQPEGYRIKANFLGQFEIEKGPHCAYDYLEIYDDNKSIGKFCGTSFPGGNNGIQAGRKMTIVFSSDESLTYSGFYIQYCAEEKTTKPSTCGFKTASSGQGDDEELDEEYFLCNNSQVVYRIATCDGNNDCGDNSDESTDLAGCPAEWTCESGNETIPEYQKCNGNFDCSDHSDESVSLKCTRYLCPDGYQIIPENFICNHVADCTDGWDESPDAGCNANFCSGNPCKNNGSCTSLSTSYKCTCIGQWTGSDCTTDSTNSCDSNPCQNNAKCFDGVDTFYCACPNGFLGKQCEKSVPVSPKLQLYVSDVLGEDQRNCGENSQTPCKSLSYVVARARYASTILLLSNTSSSTADELIWIHKSLIFRTPCKTNITLNAQLLIAASGESDNVVVSMQDMCMTGFYFVGDASLSLSRVTLHSARIEQEYQRRSPIKRIIYTLQNCKINMSTIVTLPRKTATNAVQDYQNVENAELLVQGTIGYDVFINITAIRTDLKIIQSKFTRTGEDTLTTTGLSVNVGIKTDGTRDHSDPERRKKRWIPDFDKSQSQATDSDTKYGGIGTDTGSRNAFQKIQAFIGQVRQPRGGVTSQFYVAEEKYERSRTRPKRNTKPEPTIDEAKGVTSVVIQETLFQKLNQDDTIDQASLVINLADDHHVFITKTEFLDNERAIQIEVSNGCKGSVYVSGCNFTNNHSQGPGGAIHANMEDGHFNLRVSNCIFNSNYATSLTSVQSTTNHSIYEHEGSSDYIDVTKVTGSGGAIAITVGNLRVTNKYSVDIFRCSFVNNSAQNYGGSIYFTSGVYATLYGNSFSNTEDGVLRPSVGDIIESRADMYMRNNTFSVKTAANVIPIVSYRADKDGSYLQTNNLDLTCPKGYSAETVTSTIQTVSRLYVEALLVYCRSCSSSSYALDGGQIVLDQQDSLYVEYSQNATCLRCPYGADCDITVQAWANYWGEEYGGQVYMYTCAENYCCQPQVKNKCQTYRTCADQREGTMCGRCKAGYSESLFSPKCIRDSLCSYATWFWLVIAGYGILYVLLFTFEEEVQLIVGSFSRWMIKKIKNCCRIKSRAVGASEAVETAAGVDVRYVSRANSTFTVQDVEEVEAEGAYLQIAMYYFQVPSLLKIKILYEGNRQQPLESMTDWIKNVFSFNTFGLNLNTCLFKGVTAVFKTWVKSAYILYLFVVWAIFFVFAGLLSYCKRGRGCCFPWPVHITIRARFLGTLVNLLLYTYQYFAENSFNLLKCVSIKSQPSKVLFIDGNVSCYQDWQWIILTFAFLYVLPFFAVLLLAPSLLHERIINVRRFILCLLFPLFSTPYLIYLYWFSYDSTGTRFQYAEVKQSRTDETGGSVEIIMKMLSEPYRQDLKGGLCWEGIIALRRLLLVLLSTLVTSVIYKHIGLTVVCFFSLLTHIKNKPFIKPSSNNLEAVSLTILVFISIMNLLKAGYFDAGVIPQGVSNVVFQIYDWLEAILLGVIPAVIMGFGVLALIIRILAFCVGKCYYWCSSRMNRMREQVYPTSINLWRLPRVALPPQTSNIFPEWPSIAMPSMTDTRANYISPYYYNTAEFH